MGILIRIFFLVVAGLVCVFDPDAPKNAAAEMVTFSAIVSAGAVSAMIFSGTVLGTRVRQKLLDVVETKFWGSHQNFWYLMFSFATLTSVLVIIGQLIDWNLPLSASMFGQSFTFDFARIIAALSILSLGLSVALMLDFGKAVKDIIDLAARDKEVENQYSSPSALDVNETVNTVSSQE